MKRARARPQSVAEIERERLENFEANEIRRPPPPLSKKPSKTTLEAIAIIPEWTLYKLLHLDTFSADPLHVQRRDVVKQEARRMRGERSRWLKISRHLRAALADARHFSPAAHEPTTAARYCDSCDLFGHECFSTDERFIALCEWLATHKPNDTGPAEKFASDIAADVLRRLEPNTISPRWPIPSSWDALRVAREMHRMLNARAARQEFRAVANMLDALAESARLLAAGDDDPLWNPLERARANAARSPKDMLAITRERAKMLEEKLRWHRGKIADLIMASEKDWDPAPVKLARELHDPATLRDRFRDLVDPRSKRRR